MVRELIDFFCADAGRFSTPGDQRCRLVCATVYSFARLRARNTPGSWLAWASRTRGDEWGKAVGMTYRIRAATLGGRAHLSRKTCSNEKVAGRGRSANQAASLRKTMAISASRINLFPVIRLAGFSISFSMLLRLLAVLCKLGARN